MTDNPVLRCELRVHSQRTDSGTYMLHTRVQRKSSVKDHDLRSLEVVTCYQCVYLLLFGTTGNRSRHDFGLKEHNTSRVGAVVLGNKLSTHIGTGHSCRQSDL